MEQKVRAENASATVENKTNGCSEHVVEIEWKQFDFLSAISGLYTASVERRKCNLSVLVQGNLGDLEGKMVILTVHDVGKNNLCFVDYVNSPSMASLRERAVFLHVCVPGQEPEAPTFAGHSAMPWPKYCAISKSPVVLRWAKVPLDFPSMVKGMVLIHCTSTPHGIVKHIKEIFAGLRLEDGEMTQSGWNYLLTHRFGNHNLDATQKHYVDLLKSVMNKRNLSRYLYSFGHRSDFTDRLKEKLANVDVLLVTGANAPHNDNMMHMFKNMNKDRTGLLLAEGCLDVLEEACPPAD
uniref:BK_channel_a domain-containing protein n=1 Tax=Globodera pallida TaxID=36090 RepID=A0A183C9J3_GLOPA